jgi:hypothetical protein
MDIRKNTEFKNIKVSIGGEEVGTLKGISHLHSVPKDLPELRKVRLPTWAPVAVTIIKDADFDHAAWEQFLARTERSPVLDLTLLKRRKFWWPVIRMLMNVRVADMEIESAGCLIGIMDADTCTKWPWYKAAMYWIQNGFKVPESIIYHWR